MNELEWIFPVGDTYTQLKAAVFLAVFERWAEMENSKNSDCSYIFLCLCIFYWIASRTESVCEQTEACPGEKLWEREEGETK